jgi:hypothetical protein
MGRRGRTVLWAVVLAAACGVLVWHLASWHYGGKHDEIYDQIGRGRGYLAALYNLGTILGLGLLLGLLVDRLSDLIRRSTRKHE